MSIRRIPHFVCLHLLWNCDDGGGPCAFLDPFRLLFTQSETTHLYSERNCVAFRHKTREEEKEELDDF